MTEDVRELEPKETAPLPEPAKLLRRSFARLRRELTDDELSSSAVQRLLLDDLDRLEKELERLQEYRERYYECRRESAVLTAKLSHIIGNDILYGVALTVGAAAVGYAPSAWDQQPTGVLALLFGAVLIVGTAVARARQRQ